MSHIIIRPATSEDSELLVKLIHSLAEYVGSPEKCTITAELVHTHLVGEHPAAEALIGECDGRAEGFALFFTTFSTWLGRPGLYLEDLFVNENSRGKGIGKALLLHLVTIALERGCGRLEWAVLDWNASAIEFYKRLGAIPLDEYTIYRLTEEAMLKLTP